MITILFICVHNSGRSQMAEAFFNHLAEGRARAISAGSQPDDNVNPLAVEAMREAGIDISNKKPKLLTIEVMEGIDRAITMGCGTTCPVTTVKTEDWGLEDPKDRPLPEVREIRDEIKNRVENLLRKTKNE
jgi:protein-tyrosine-phosphatase